MSRKPRLWYLAHPIAGDGRFTTEQNLDHIAFLIRSAWKRGLVLFSPYHTVVSVLTDSNPKERELGLAADCRLIQRFDGIILAGHKTSSGMLEEEASFAKTRKGVTIDLVGIPDFMIASTFDFVNRLR